MAKDGHNPTGRHNEDFSKTQEQVQKKTLGPVDESALSSPLHSHFLCECVIQFCPLSSYHFTPLL